VWVGVHGVVTGSWAVAPWLPSSQSVALSRNLYLPHLAQIARPPRSIARLASRRYLRGARSTWVLVLSGSQTRLRVPCPGQQEGSARPPSPPPAAPAVSIAARSSAAAPRTSSRRVPGRAPPPTALARRGHPPRRIPGAPPPPPAVGDPGALPGSKTPVLFRDAADIVPAGSREGRPPPAARRPPSTGRRVAAERRGISILGAR